jgi:hypothetical protein
MMNVAHAEQDIVLPRMRLASARAQSIFHHRDSHGTISGLGTLSEDVMSLTSMVFATARNQSSAGSVRVS